MRARKYPIQVVVIAWLYIVVGAIGLVDHFPRSMVFHQDDVRILLTELLAVTAGVFMLRGHNWARWLAIAWMAFHVAHSWPAVRQLAVHLLILAAIAWLLFRPEASQYFEREESEI